MTNVLLHLYAASPPPAVLKPSASHVAHANGHARTASTQMRDAEEFELEGLMSEDEDSLDTPTGAPAMTKRTERVA